MDGNLILLIVFWVVNNALMYRVGYSRAFKDAADVLADEVLNTLDRPDDSGDATYWRKMYEDAVNDIQQELGRTDAPGETTE